MAEEPSVSSTSRVGTKGWWEKPVGIVTLGIVVTVLGGIILWLVLRPFDKPTTSAIEPSKTLLQSKQPEAAATTSSQTNPSKQGPTAPKSKSIQHATTRISGNSNVAGNNVNGSGNVVGNNNQVSGPTASAPNGIAVAGGTVNNPTVNILAAPMPTEKELRQDLVQLAQDMNDFIVATPDITVTQFHHEFGVRASDILSKLESKYRIIAPSDATHFTESQYTSDARWYCSKVANAYKSLAAWLPIEQTYRDVSNAKLGQEISDEIMLISGQVEETKTRMQNSDRNFPLSAQRESFYYHFKDCCLTVVRDLRGAALRRIGPAYFDNTEMRDFAGLMAMEDHDGLFWASRYLRHLQVMANVLTANGSSQ